ncbi:MAG: DeoR/GlpR family DNA-binding transcription regulator [Clostridia bacterium]
MSNERRALIREYIDAHGEADLAQLMEIAGGCSSMTLWRDLNQLEHEGVIRRTHGGAISVRMLQPEVEGLYSQRAMEHTDAKRRIALCAVPYVLPEHSIYLDAGSTVMGVAQLLPDQRFTVITSGVNIAMELSQRHSCSVILVGGQVSGTTLSCSGAQSEACVDGLNIDVAIISVSGYSVAAGFTSGSASETALKAKVIKKANRVLLLMDSSKIGRNLPYTFATMEDIDVLISECPLPSEIQKQAAACGVEMIISEC